jgi:guanylate kinase
MIETDLLRQQKKGLMLILSSPSGAGKTTIAGKLMERNPHIKASVSVTTRPPRPTEKDGVDYHFVSEEQFQDMVAAQAFLEYATVFKYSYGTPVKPVREALTDGFDVLFDIDWQGTQQIRLMARKEMVSVFILPPSIKELKQRLLGRGADTQDVIDFRMGKAISEISHWAEYDYVIVNHDLLISVQQIEAILLAEKLRLKRRPELPNLIRMLQQEGQ